MEIGKNPLGSWIQISAGSAGSWDFLENLVWFRTDLNLLWQGDINAINYNRNKWRIFLILVRIWNQRKRWLRYWHMSGGGYWVLKVCVWGWVLWCNIYAEFEPNRTGSVSKWPKFDRFDVEWPIWDYQLHWFIFWNLKSGALRDHQIKPIENQAQSQT